MPVFRTLLPALLSGVVALVVSTAAQAACARTELQAAVDGYLSAQAAGNSALMKQYEAARYFENMQPSTRESSILNTPMKIDFHRSLLDTALCESFTEVIVTDKSHPYVLGVRLRSVLGKVSEFDALVTDQGDWLFNADNYLKYSPAEDWGPIPAAHRGTRESLVAAANAYEDAFLDNAVAVPWGLPCNRLEGGVRTGKGKPDDSCNVGLPEGGLNITARRYVADPETGAVVILSKFSDNDQPDSHLFRIEQGRIRYAHTLTVCTLPNCGFPALPPPRPESRP